VNVVLKQYLKQVVKKGVDTSAKNVGIHNQTGSKNDEQGRNNHEV